MKMELFRITLSMLTSRTLQAICVHVNRFVIGKHGYQKFHPAVK